MKQLLLLGHIAVVDQEMEERSSKDRREDFLHIAREKQSHIYQGPKQKILFFTNFYLFKFFFFLNVKS